MKIKIFDDLFLLQRVDHLIRTCATGTPEQLADRLGCCERDVYRLLADLRDQGFPIAYDRQADTYYYIEPVKLHISIVVGSEKLLTIQGGEKKINFFERLPDFGSEGKHFCNTFYSYAVRASE
jgi:biotin operon repressor